MKKNMIALAVAGALVAPVAMADVTVSGGLQAELVQIGGNGATPNGLYINDGKELPTAGTEGNYGFLKFSGSEDLGGGLKALASYNMNVSAASSTAFGKRDAFVGLSHDTYGAILAGRLATPYKSSTVNYDPMLATSFQARGNYGMSGLNNGYVNNAVAYANSFAGGMVKVVAALVVDSTPKNNADKTVGKHAKSFSVNIDPIAGLDIAIAYIDKTNFGNANIDVPGNNQSDVNATKIGAKYTMGAFTVAGQYEMLNKGMTATGDKGNVAYVTGSFKFDDANTLSVAVGKSDKNAVAYVANATTATTTVVGGHDGTYAAVDFNHAFSKNTSAYVGYRISDAKTLDSVTIDNATGALVSVNAPVDSKETAIGAGLRVSF